MKDWRARAFDRIISDVTITPRNTGCTANQETVGGDTYKCFLTGEKPVVLIKHRAFAFFVNKILTITDVIFNGGDLYHIFASPTSSCVTTQ